MRLFTKRYVLVMLTTLAIITSAVRQVNAQIVTPDLKNLKALTETAVTTMSLIIQNFGFSPEEKLDFTGEFTDSDWFLTIDGTYLSLPVKLSFNGSFNEVSNRGVFNSSGRMGLSDWTGSGSYRVSDIGSKGFSIIFESEARIDNRVINIHVRKQWTFQQKGKHIVSEDIGTVQLTENGHALGRPLRERSFDIFGITPPKTGTTQVSIADGSSLKGTFDLDSEVRGSILTVLALALAQQDLEKIELEVHLVKITNEPGGSKISAEKLQGLGKTLEEEINKIWAQVGITFEISKTLETLEVQDKDSFQGVVFQLATGDDLSKGGVELFEFQSQHPGIIHIFLVDDLGSGKSGVTASRDKNNKIRLSREEGNDPGNAVAVVDDSADAQTVAHEIGHVLGLPDIAAGSLEGNRKNLMWFNRRERIGTELGSGAPGGSVGFGGTFEGNQTTQSRKTAKGLQKKKR